MIVRRILFCMATIVAATTASTRTASAQHQLGIADLNGRVSAALEARIQMLADSAAVAHLPASSLIDKALEGASKGAPDARIVSAVHVVLTNLAIARHALGSKASDPELVAGAAVLRAGVSAAALADARRRLPHRSLTVPLSVLGSLVAAGVPSTDALGAVVARASRADDASMLAFGREVERSIAAGVPAYTVVSAAAGGAVGLGGSSASQPGTRPKP